MLTDIDEEILDLDWFGVDKSGEVAHFATAGQGYLPLSVKASKVNMDTLSTYFREHLSASTTGMVSDRLWLHVAFKSESKRQLFLEEFLPFGAKGLYSFTSIVTHYRPTGYYNVVRPSRALLIKTLPIEIQNILSLTRLDCEFTRLDIVTMNDLCKGAR